MTSGIQHVILIGYAELVVFLDETNTTNPKYHALKIAAADSNIPAVINLAGQQFSLRPGWRILRQYLL
jgi:ABC-type phosphate/phosphonate transport system substrate-binding protein